jgi:putative hydrolase of the HAD superfamily
VDSTRLAAVSFDLWGTLIGSHPDFKAHRNELLRRRLAPGTTPELFTATLRAADRAADEESIVAGTDIGFLPRVESALDRLGVRATITPADTEEMEAEQRRTALAYPPQPLHPDLPRLLAELARIVPLAITSNTGMLPGTLMRDLLRPQGLLECFTVQTFSNEVQFAKPHPGIFQHTLEGLGAPDPASVLHVGDNPQADIQGAAGAGMATALVTPTETAASLITAILASAEVPA